MTAPRMNVLIIGGGPIGPRWTAHFRGPVFSTQHTEDVARIGQSEAADNGTPVVRDSASCQRREL